MDETKFIDNVKEAGILVGLSAGFGLIVKKVFNKSVTNDPTSNIMNFGTWVVLMTGTLFGRDYLIKQKILPT